MAAISAFRLTSADPESLARFYADIGFTVSPMEQIPLEEMVFLGVAGRGRRISMRLGEQRVDIDGFEQRGRPYPTDISPTDLRFQHLAIVTSDAQAAWKRAQSAGANSISTCGAVTLPASCGGVTAVKFRDPEGHPLEFLQFPLEADNGWQGSGMLGIDHSAISVANAKISTAFYLRTGLTAGRASLNRGATQEALDGLEQVRVDVVPLLPPVHTPHLELLAYRVPRGAPSDRMEPNDIAATRVVWSADRNALLRDPDGHLHLLNCRATRRPSLRGSEE